MFLGEGKELAMQEQLKIPGWPHLSPEDLGWDPPATAAKERQLPGWVSHCGQRFLVFEEVRYLLEAV